MYTINKNNEEIPIEEVHLDDLYDLLNKYDKIYPYTDSISKWSRKWVTVLDNEIKIRRRKDKLKKIINNVL